MLARASSLILFLLFALPLLVAAGSVIPRHAPPANPPPASHPPVNQCNTGTINCCNSVTESDSELATSITGLLGVVVGPLSQLIGLQCTGVVGGTDCSNHSVCCSGNTYNGGLIVLGCSPINVSL